MTAVDEQTGKHMKGNPELSNTGLRRILRAPVHKHDRRFSPKQIARLLRLHKMWLQADPSGDGKRANFQHAILRGANLQGAELQIANLLCADLESADLQNAKLRGAVLQGANLDGAKLHSATLQGADLFRARLSHAILHGANLQGAKLQRACLQNGDLRAVNLRMADLRGAVLTDSDLRFAHIQGADLRGANLSGADLSAVQGLEAADLMPEDLEGAILPSSFAEIFLRHDDPKGTIGPSEASNYLQLDSGGKEQASREAMSHSVDVDEILVMQVQTLASSVQSSFQQLVERLRHHGLDGLPEADKERLEDDTLPEEGAVWRVRVNDEYRAFVLEKDSGLEVVHLASVRTLNTMKSLGNSN